MNSKPLIHLTGTCAQCKGRLRFAATEVLRAHELHCPHCEISIDTRSFKLMAQHLLSD